MSCITWNARGLGNPRAFRELRRLVRERKPDLLFICESKVRSSLCSRWKAQLDFLGHFVVDPRGKGGGLMLLWSSSVDVQIQSFSMGHIDCIVHHNNFRWRFTGFYGHPLLSMRESSWELLGRLHSLSANPQIPWLVGGDFNEIMFDIEKLGGPVKLPSQLRKFRDIIDKCGLMDLMFKGDPYTWCNKREGANLIFERLDRLLCNVEWKSIYPFAQVSHLEFYGSDHRAIHVHFLLDESRNITIGPKRFFFEHKWILEEDFAPFIKESWLSLGPGLGVPDKLRIFQSKLRDWAGARFDQLGRKIKMLRHSLNLLSHSTLRGANLQRISELEAEIERRSTQEELHWQQRSRATWLQHGDHNTKIFHSFASGRKKSNHIRGLLSEDGIWSDNASDMASITFQYFQTLFASSLTSPQPFSAAEIQKAVFELHPSKAPGPDGYTALFFQKFWSVIGDEITAAALNILNQKGDVSLWNATLITLIPKINDPTQPQHFRPISLCNTAYKIIARAIVNRIRPVLGSIIDNSQSAFVPGRLITDNIIVGYECMHWIRHHHKRKTGYAALKLDMSKAYDRVEWVFLEGMLSKLGFAHDWIQLIMRAIISDSLQVRQCIRLYEVASGQVVNYDKSAISFCPSTSVRIMEEIREVFGIPIVRGHDLYLGLPTFSLRSKRIQFANLRDRVFQRVNGWRSKLFSAGGKETLIKSVLQAIPTYAMSCFKIPVSLCSEIEQLCASYWWSSSMDRRGMHWTQWKNLCKPKQLGGMGFRSMIEFNKVLLAKQLWRIIQFPDSLMAKVLKARYFREVDILDARQRSNSSYLWQSLLWSRDLIVKGIRWRVGDGRTINP